MGARQHPHEGRLAGAVVAHETDQLAGKEVDRHVADGVDAAEGDVDVAHLDERVRRVNGQSVAHASWHGHPLTAAPAVEGVEADGQDQDDAGDDVLARRVDAHEAQPVGERLHHERAQHGARDRADAARERRPADDRRRDDVQLVALADVERGAVEPRGGDGRGQGAQHAHQDVGLQDRPARVDAGQLGRVGIAAVGVHVSPEPSPGRYPGHHQGHADEQHDRVREAGRDLQAARRRRDPVTRGVLVGEALWPEVVVGEPGQAEHRDAADRADQSLRPDGPQGESVAPALAPVVVEQADDRHAADHSHGPGDHLAGRAEGATADELEGRVEAGDRRALRLVPDHAADREQSAEGDDERGHADVGDDEPCSAPTAAPMPIPRTRASAHWNGTSAADPEDVRKPVGHQQRVGHGDDADERPDRQVDVARDDDQDHARGDDRDAARLHGHRDHVRRLDQLVAAGDVEDDQDHGRGRRACRTGGGRSPSGQSAHPEIAGSVFAPDPETGAASATFVTTALRPCGRPLALEKRPAPPDVRGRRSGLTRSAVPGPLLAGGWCRRGRRVDALAEGVLGDLPAVDRDLQVVRGERGGLQDERADRVLARSRERLRRQGRPSGQRKDRSGRSGESGWPCHRPRTARAQPQQRPCPARWRS